MAVVAPLVEKEHLVGLDLDLSAGLALLCLVAIERDAPLDVDQTALGAVLVDDVVRAGIKAILNFAPVNLKVPDDVYLRNENMSMEMEYLSFAMVNLRK